MVCSVIVHGLSDTPGSEWIGRRAEAREREPRGGGGVSSLDGRRFRAVAEVAGGDVGPQTEFEYVERDDGVIHARYAGGAVRLGFLVGTRAGDSAALPLRPAARGRPHRDRPLRVAHRGAARRAPAPARDVGVGLAAGQRHERRRGDPLAPLALQIRDKFGGGRSETSSQGALTTLPQTWVTGHTYSDGPLSATGGP